jgi:hypothetical protein
MKTFKQKHIFDGQLNVLSQLAAITFISSFYLKETPVDGALETQVKEKF